MDDRIEAAEAWAELVDDLRRNRVFTSTGERKLGMTREMIAALDMPVYDLRSVGEVGPQDTDELALRMTQAFPRRVILMGANNRLGINRPTSITIPDPDGSAFTIYVRRDFGWVNYGLVSDGDGVIALNVANMLIDDAEANIEIRDAPAPRFDVVNRGRVGAGLPPLQRPRVISLSSPRIQYENPAPGRGQGGTHARPVEHTRTLTERVITPRNRKAYVRKAKVITVNKGITRVTEVRP